MRHATSPLLGLLAAAAALDPALAQDEVQRGFSYRYQHYDEASFEGPAIGARDRYTIRTHQFQFSTGVGDGFVLTLDGLSEVMSGSSPWFLLPDADGEPVQVLSGATIADDRRELAATLSTPRRGGVQHTLRAQLSDEDDYHAFAVGYELSKALGEQLTLAGGLSHSDDRIEPTDAALYGRVPRADKRTSGAFVSLTAVLDRDSQLQAGLSLSRGSGFLSDPYKQVFVAGVVLPDTRPDSRLQSALVLRYRRAFQAGRAALHADFRYTRDDWGLHSQSLEAAFHQPFGSGFELRSALRYYSQDGADFYAPLHLVGPADQVYSSDYRLGRFGAFSLALTLRKQWQQLAVLVTAERYRSATGYALGGSGAAVPGLVDFDRLGVGVEWSF